VDFLHQFWRLVVPKEDKTLPWQALRLPFCEALRVCGRYSAERALDRPAKNALNLIRERVFWSQAD
jgi:hypothetical protein